MFCVYFFVFGVGRWMLLCSVIPLDTKKKGDVSSNWLFKAGSCYLLARCFRVFWLMLHHTSFAM